LNVQPIIVAVAMATSSSDFHWRKWVRIGITGAGGFVGAALVRHLLDAGRLDPNAEPIESVVAVDAALPDFADSRVVPLEGSILDTGLYDAMTARALDCVFHLAAVPGGAAAANYELGWRVNVEASIDLMERLARQKSPPRLVFASSIGIFGAPLPETLDDSTLPLPSMSYGAQKLIIETLVNDMARRGALDGRAPRLPGIIARPRAKGGHLSAYMSDILHVLAAGEDFVCPVSPQATSWLMSRERCVDNLIHAAVIAPSELEARRAFTLPALRVSMADLVEGLAARFGAKTRDQVRFEPNAALEAQFGAYPLLSTALADRLGFRHDGNVAALITRALALSHGGPDDRIS
jgi:nucleoside-diphosphate-sugar epimerase